MMTDHNDRYTFRPIGAFPRPGDVRRGHRAVREGFTNLVSDTESYCDVLKGTFEELSAEERVGGSKTDQEGAGVQIGVPYGSTLETCPVRTLRQWLDQSGVTAGAVFRFVDRHGRVSGSRMAARTVAATVQKAIAATGKDPAAFGAHSLRSGLCTAAAEKGVPERSIAAVSRHKSMAVLRRYIRAGDLFRDHPAAQVGL